MSNRLRFLCWRSILLALLSVVVLLGEEPKPAVPHTSIRPGINDSYRQPDVKQSQERFEKEGRDIYDFRNAILHNCRLKPGMSVADIGCGTGLFTRMFAKAVGPTGKVYAVDIAPTFLTHVEKTSREQGFQNVVPVKATDNDARLTENLVDRIFICDVYHHFEFPEETLQSLYRALKSDGELIVIDFQRIPGKSREFVLGHVRAPQGVFVREISACGFKLVEERPGMLVESYFLRFKKTASPYGEPERTGKKLIEWGGGDEPETSFLRAHLTEMEKLLFDGVVFHVNDRQGENITWNLWGGKTYDQAQLQHAFDDLKALRPKTLTELFVRVNVTPGKIDWFDDEAWRGVLQNVSLFAKLAKEGGCRGFMFDTEQYQGELFHYKKQKERTFAAYDVQLRKRGKEWIQAINKEYPEITILMTFGYSYAYPRREGEKTLADTEYGLLPAFLDGVLEGCTDQTKLVDAFESSYRYKTEEQFQKAYDAIHRKARNWSSHPDKYARHVTAGFGLWMDYDSSKNGWNVEETGKNYFPPDEFGTAVRRALTRSDNYVWVYTEKPRWWTNEKLPQAYVRELRSAQSP